MSYRGTLSSGQTFAGQQGHMQGHQNGFSYQQVSDMPENERQQHLHQLNRQQQQLHHHHQQIQQQQHYQPLQPAHHHGQPVMYPTGISHGQQQFYQNMQSGQPGFYLPQPPQQQQFQQPAQRQMPPVMTYHTNSPTFNTYQHFDAGRHERPPQMQPTENRYIHSPQVWQQPMTQLSQHAAQQPSMQQPPQHQSVNIQPAPQQQQQQQHHRQLSSQSYYSPTPNTPPVQMRDSPLLQQTWQTPQPSPHVQQRHLPQTPQQLHDLKRPSSQQPEPIHTQRAPTIVPPPMVEPQDVHPPPVEETQHKFEYVNLQDIQKQPLLPALPVMTKKRTMEELAQGERVEDCIVVKQPRLDSKPIKQEEDSSHTPRVSQHLPEARVKYSPHSSVTNSPALSTRSPSIARRSPATHPKARPAHTTPLMVAVAEECLEKARAASHDVAMTLSADQVDEYQKLIATSLSCLEAALQSNQLPPREEARVRLRYAAVLQEETENLMEAETALGKGITLCDKHRLYDLKYCMQYLMLKVLFQRNHKAALKAIDGHISNCEAFKHVQWFYAFRLLKAFFYLEIGNVADAGVLDNVRSIQSVANTRGDNAVSVLASLLEGFALLKITKDGSMERIQACIAQIAKFQFDPTVQQIVQLNVLTLLLEVTASLHHQNPDHTAQKLRLLQKALDECEGWNNVKSDFLLPVNKQSSSTTKTVSEDTQMVIQMGEGEQETDYVVMTFMTKMELRSLVFTISGLANFHKPGRRSTEFWQEGLRILDTWDSSTAGIPYGHAVSLGVAMKQRAWRIEAQAYLNTLLGLVAASQCQWANVKQVIQKLGTLVSPSTQSTVRLLSTYLTGVYHQGIGDFQTAINIFRDNCFAVPSQGAGTKAGQQEITLLAGLNRLWIMQHQSCRNDQETMDLMEQLQPLCVNHSNFDLRTAWHNVMAALVTEPPQQLTQQKQHIHAAMAGSRTTGNVLGAAVTLCIMRSRFFENVIGEQALKSALAAAKQAQRSGNVLWQSVADGMLAQSYEVMGQREEARQEWDKAIMEARSAFPWSS